jgi:hypothetical protein
MGFAELSVICVIPVFSGFFKGKQVDLDRIIPQKNTEKFHPYLVRQQEGHDIWKSLSWCRTSPPPSSGLTNVGLKQPMRGQARFTNLESVLIVRRGPSI